MRTPLLVVGLVVLSASCGGKNVQHDPAPLESSPWLLTIERAERTRPGGPLRAHRLYEGKVISELLDSSATLAPSWSPSRRWMAYRTVERAEGEMLRLRRLDGDHWGDPVTITMPGPDAASVSGNPAWSPTRDRLLLRSPTALAVALPRDDGSITTKPIPAQDILSVTWAPDADRIVVMRGPRQERRASIYDIADGPEPVTQSHEIAPPDGMTFDDLDPGHDETGIPNGSISGDGRWIVFVVKRGEADSVKALYAFSTTGEPSSHALEGCGISATPGTPTAALEVCRPESWRPGSGTLLLTRRGANGQKTLDAWTPATDTVVSLGSVTSSGWVGPARSLLLVQHAGSKQHSVVDLRDGSSPVVTPLPTSELPSFEGATPSTDGRWVIVNHVDRQSKEGWLSAIDLAGAPPWTAREIHRGTSEVARNGLYWSPGGSFILIAEPQQRPSAPVVRGTRIDVATGATSVLEIDLPSPDAGEIPISWQWGDRIAYDDRTLAIPHEGALALWRMDAAKGTAAKLEGVSATTSVRWAPVP